MPAACTEPRRLARAILSAWTSASPTELARQLRRGERCRALSSDTLTAERAELLAAVASDIRRTLGRLPHPADGAAASLEVHLCLLRHLAG
jgi:hypothetical protein